jgi:hypothetical protein
MKKNIAEKVLKTLEKAPRYFLWFALTVITKVLADSAKKEKYKPTLHEIMHGEKIPFSDKYFVPDEKFHK